MIKVIFYRYLIYTYINVCTIEKKSICARLETKTKYTICLYARSKVEDKDNASRISCIHSFTYYLICKLSMTITYIGNEKNWNKELYFNWCTINRPFFRRTVWSRSIRGVKKHQS